MCFTLKTDLKQTNVIKQMKSPKRKSHFFKSNFKFQLWSHQAGHFKSSFTFQHQPGTTGSVSIAWLNQWMLFYEKKAATSGSLEPLLIFSSLKPHSCAAWRRVGERTAKTSKTTISQCRLTVRRVRMRIATTIKISPLTKQTPKDTSAKFWQLLLQLISYNLLTV